MKASLKFSQDENRVTKYKEEKTKMSQIVLMRHSYFLKQIYYLISHINLIDNLKYKIKLFHCSVHKCQKYKELK